MSWARYVTGWATVEVSGAEPEKFLYALAERGITFWDAVPPKNYTLTVKVPEHAVKLMGPLAASLGCEGTIRSHHGLPAFARKISRRYMLLGCIALVLALLFVGSAFVWEIDITGNETIPDGVIRQALAECGVDIGAFWPRFSQDLIRNGVILRVDGIRWMTVTIRGSHARVIVREARTHLPLVPEKEFAKVVADKAGLVESVSALRGTALTEEGRAVLPGDVLIGGYKTGRFAVLGPTRAIGSVTARTWYELTAEAPVQTDVKAYDGDKSTRWSLILGKTRINFYKGSSICPAGCDKIIMEHALASDGLFTLPITLVQTVYTSYDRRTALKEELRVEMEQLLMQTLQSSLAENGEIISADYTASEKEGLMYVTLRAECREQIGTPVPLTEKDFYEIEQKMPKTEDNSQ